MLSTSAAMATMAYCIRYLIDLNPYSFKPIHYKWNDFRGDHAVCCDRPFFLSKGYDYCCRHGRGEE